MDTTEYVRLRDAPRRKAGRGSSLRDSGRRDDTTRVIGFDLIVQLRHFRLLIVINLSCPSETVQFSPPFSNPAGWDLVNLLEPFGLLSRQNGKRARSLVRKMIADQISNQRFWGAAKLGSSIANSLVKWGW
jgi:hypothetical protein